MYKTVSSVNSFERVAAGGSGSFQLFVSTWPRKEAWWWWCVCTAAAVVVFFVSPPSVLRPPSTRKKRSGGASLQGRRPAVRLLRRPRDFTLLVRVRVCRRSQVAVRLSVSVLVPSRRSHVRVVTRNRKGQHAFLSAGPSYGAVGQQRSAALSGLRPCRPSS